MVRSYDSYEAAKITWMLNGLRWANELSVSLQRSVHLVHYYTDVASATKIIHYYWLQMAETCFQPLGAPQAKNNVIISHFIPFSFEYSMHLCRTSARKFSR
jgi:hypothetical protein